jgi:hypothetical protein
VVASFYSDCSGANALFTYPQAVCDVGNCIGSTSADNVDFSFKSYQLSASYKVSFFSRIGTDGNPMCGNVRGTGSLQLLAATFPSTFYCSGAGSYVCSGGNLDFATPNSGNNNGLSRYAIYPKAADFYSECNPTTASVPTATVWADAKTATSAGTRVTTGNSNTNWTYDAVRVYPGYTLTVYSNHDYRGSRCTIVGDGTFVSLCTTARCSSILRDTLSSYNITR